MMCDQKWKEDDSSVSIKFGCIPEPRADSVRSPKKDFRNLLRSTFPAVDPINLHLSFGSHALSLLAVAQR